MRRSAGLAASLFLTGFALAGCGHGGVIGSGPLPTPTPTIPMVTNEFAIPTANSGPWTIMSAPNGYLYFTEQTASKIGQVTTGGVMTEIPTPTSAAGPTQIILGPDSHVWFTEAAAGQMGTFSVFNSTDFTEYKIPWAGATPTSIAVGSPTNSMYFIDSSHNAIGRVMTDGTFSGPYAIPTANSGAQDLVTGPDLNIWFTEYNAGKIGHFNVATNTVDTEYALPAGAKPDTIIVGQDGALWFTDDNPAAPALGRITTSGLITEYPLTGAKSAVGLVQDVQNNLDITDSVNSAIGVFNPTTKTFTEYPTKTASADPLWIALGPDRLLYFTENAANKIGQFDY